MTSATGAAAVVLSGSAGVSAAVVLTGRIRGVSTAGNSTGRAGLVGSSIAAGFAGSSTGAGLCTSSALPSSSGRPLIVVSIVPAGFCLARRRSQMNTAMASAMSTIGIAVARAIVMVLPWLAAGWSVPVPDESVVGAAGSEAPPGDGSILVDAGVAPDAVVVMLNSARLFHKTGIAGAQISVYAPVRTSVPSVKVVTMAGEIGV